MILVCPECVFPVPPDCISDLNFEGIFISFYIQCALIVDTFFSTTSWSIADIAFDVHPDFISAVKGCNYCASDHVGSVSYCGFSSLTSICICSSSNLIRRINPPCVKVLKNILPSSLHNAPLVCKGSSMHFNIQV